MAMSIGCTCRVGKCCIVEQYFWRVMEIHYLFPFVEQRLDKCGFCRRAQQRWCLLTFSRGLDSGTWEADGLHCSPLAAVSCLSLVDAVIGHIFFLSFTFSSSQPPLARSDTHLFQQCCCFFVHFAQPPCSFLPLPEKAMEEIFNIHFSNPLHISLFA